MKNMLKTIMAVGLVFLLLLFSSYSVASAETKIITIQDTKMEMSTSINEKNAYASTYAGLGQAWTSVDAKYVYINVNLQSSDRDKTGTLWFSNSGHMGSGVNFSAPNDCRSVRVSADHVISCGTAYYSDSTAADY